MRISCLILTLAILTLPGLALAQDLSPESIRCNLDPSCVKPSKKSPCGNLRCIDLAGVATAKPDTIPQSVTIDLELAFERNSAILQPDARIALDTLCRALKDPSLIGEKFLIAGHTDAKGSRAHNMRLSKLRAEAMRDYLATHCGIARGRLVAEGFGSTQLIDPEHPMSARNRRIQVIKLTAPTPHL
jgi:outer membrane protein OmpA-like peptidoglycan-associated protein